MTAGNTSDYLPYATLAGANVETQQQFAVDPELGQGMVGGRARSALFNKIMRQASSAAAMIAQFTANYGPNSVTDDGNITNFENNFVAALKQLFVGIPDLLDQGSLNSLIINPTTPETAYAVPMLFIIKVLDTNTGNVVLNVSGLGQVPVVRPSGAQLLPGDIIAGGKIFVAYDGINFQMLSNLGATPGPPMVIHFARDSSVTPNTVIIPTDATVQALTSPMFFYVIIGNSNTGATIGNVNGLGNVAITRGSGGVLATGDIVAGTGAFLCFDGSELQLLNPQQLNSSTSGAPADWNDIVGQLAPYWLTVKSATTATPPVSPSAGDAYIIPTGATGIWTSLVGKVGQWTGSAWVYRTYPNGSLLSVTDTQRFYKQNGSAWAEVAVNPLGYSFFFSQF